MSTPEIPGGSGGSGGEPYGPGMVCPDRTAINETLRMHERGLKEGWLGVSPGMRWALIEEWADMALGKREDGRYKYPSRIRLKAGNLIRMADMDTWKKLLAAASIDEKIADKQSGPTHVTNVNVAVVSPAARYAGAFQRACRTLAGPGSGDVVHGNGAQQPVDPPPAAPKTG